jgi:membrane protease subunit HflK
MALGDPPRQVIDFPKIPKLPKIPAGGLRWVLLAVLAIWLVSTGFYTIDPEEVGVEMRFGRYTETTQPGLNFKLPLGIERVIKVPVQRQLKEEFGFRTRQPGVRTSFERGSSETGGESNLLTGDLNAAVVEWVIQYRITKPYEFLFRVRNVQDTLRDMSEAVMREVVGDRTVNEVLTVGRQEVADLVEQDLQALCDQYENGIKIDQVVLQDVNPPDRVKPSFNEVNEAQQEREKLIDQVVLQDVNPPDRVKPSFNEVNEAQQEREKLINQAQSEYNKVIPRARGRALQAIQSAEGYKLNRVNRSQGEAARFDALYAEYRKAPEVTRKRIYLETMNEVLPKIGNKIIVDDSVEGVVPLLNLTGLEIQEKKD